MKLIPLTQGQFAKVDDADFGLISSFKWCARREKDTFYAVRATSRNSPGGKSTMRMHRVISGAVHSDIVDHIDHDGLNNQRSNLRFCTHTQNMRNRRGAISNSASGMRGVSKPRGRSKWLACIRVNKKTLYLGTYNSSPEASAAYAAANKKYFGEFSGAI